MTATRPALAALRTREDAARLDTMTPFQAFARRVRQQRDELRERPAGSRTAGPFTCGYDASPKSNTPLQYCGRGPNDLPCIGEAREKKASRSTPSTWIPILPEEEAKSRRPDQPVVLPWIRLDGFVKRERAYPESGGKLVFPLPTPGAMKIWSGTTITERGAVARPDTSTAVPIPDSDLFRIDPYEAYAALREREPVSKALSIGRNAYLITRHAEADAVLRDLRFSNDPWQHERPLVRLSELADLLTEVLATLDRHRTRCSATAWGRPSPESRPGASTARAAPRTGCSSPPAAHPRPGRGRPASWRTTPRCWPEVRRLGGAPDDPGLPAMTLPALRAGYQALSPYAWRDGPGLRCPVTPLTGTQDPLRTPEQAAP